MMFGQLSCHWPGVGPMPIMHASAGVWSVVFLIWPTCAARRQIRAYPSGNSRNIVMSFWVDCCTIALRHVHTLWEVRASAVQCAVVTGQQVVKVSYHVGDRSVHRGIQVHIDRVKSRHSVSSGVVKEEIVSAESIT